MSGWAADMRPSAAIQALSCGSLLGRAGTPGCDRGRWGVWPVLMWPDSTKIGGRPARNDQADCG